MLPNNAEGLEQVSGGTAEPFLLPWIGQWVGPTKVLIFVAELEERRDHPYGKLWGMRLTFAPASFLELGSSYTVLFDGGGPYLPLRKYPNAMFPFVNPSSGENPAHPEERTDSLLGLDAD